MNKLIAATILFLAFPLFAAEAHKPPESPKDDEHWYPEFPGKDDEIHDTVSNGNLEKSRTDEPRGAQGWSHPDDFTIFWKDDPLAPEHGKVVMIDTDVLEGEAKKRQAQLREALAAGKALPPAPPKTPVTTAHQYDAIGGTYGVSVYSEKIKCKPKQAYKISFDFKGVSAGAKVWVRGWGQTTDQQGVKHDRRLWETYVNCRVKEQGWRHFEQAFHPTRRPMGKDKVKYVDVAFLRIMLYAYWPRAQYYFDNIKIEEISDEEYAKMKAIDADER